MTKAGLSARHDMRRGRRRYSTKTTVTPWA